MTKNKNLKDRVRARMAKTGESYTAARARIIDRMSKPKLVEYPTIAGMSDEALENKTGMVWAQWCGLLDAIGAQRMSHRDLAKHIREHHPEVGPWWTQTVTVGYERIRGMREVGQARDGKSFAASKSRTFSVALPTLYRAFSQKRMREKWMDAAPSVRTSSVNRSIRFDWPDRTLVAVTFIDKGPHKSSAAIEHQKLLSQKQREAEKANWSERFDTLGALW